MKRFEDLEFQQLEKESSQAEEKETQIQQLLREIAEYQHSLVTRKVCVCVYGRLSEDLFIYFCTLWFVSISKINFAGIQKHSQCTGVEDLKLNHNIFLFTYKTCTYLRKDS